MGKLLNLKLYRKDQNGTRAYIKEYLRNKGVDYIELEGCLISIKNKEAPLFVAHMDTVGEPYVEQPLLNIGGILKRKGNYVLGADDKAGINLILNHCKDVNFIFTRDEEIGCIGAKALLKIDEFVELLGELPCAIELDRKGNSDIIQYCGTDLIDSIREACPRYKVADGVFTDVIEWEHLIPAVNLSVGYYNAHSGAEYLNIEEFEYINKCIPALNEIRGPFTVEPQQYRGFGRYYGGYDYDYNYDDYDETFPEQTADDTPHYCDYCGDVPSVIYREKDGYHICQDCLEYTYGLKVIKNF